MTDRILNNRYKLEEQIGSGGMSIVYKAEDLTTGETVAIKELRSELSENDQLIRKFNQEAESAKRLTHPNIVRTRDAGYDDNIYYIVRDLVDGMTLKEYIDKEGPLAPDHAADIALKVAFGLQYAHSNGVIHRDIKPHNIIIDNDGSVKLTDFGIARVLNDETRTTEYGKSLVGTVYYTSPEQVRGLNVDERTDVYSLGVVLFEMLTGTLPFDGENAVNIAMQHVTKEAESARKYNKAVNTSLDNIIRNAMAKKLDGRYRSIDDMIRDLQKYLAGNDMGIFRIAPATVRSSSSKKGISAKKHAMKERRRKKNADDINAFLVNMLLVVLLSGLLVMLIYGIYTVGSTIIKNNFVVSTVDVPDVCGRPEAEAQKLLEDKQLIYRAVSTEYNSKIPAGYVISQTPADGETVNEDSLVQVVVSLGAFEIEIPYCVGMDIVSAEYEIKKSGYITIGKYNYVDSNEPENTIISQSLPSGTYSLDGNYVTIYFDISKGPSDEYVELRNFVGYTISTVQELAKDITIKVTYEHSDTVGKDVVISQNIPAGTVVEKGEEVHFVVSLGPEKLVEMEVLISIPDNVNVSSDGVLFVTIKQIRNGDFVTVYTGNANVENSMIEVTLEGSGTQTYYVYANNAFICTKTVDFD